jgi:hypothetical protein
MIRKNMSSSSSVLMFVLDKLTRLCIQVVNKVSLRSKEGDRERCPIRFHGKIR